MALREHLLGGLEVGRDAENFVQMEHLEDIMDHG